MLAISKSRAQHPQKINSDVPANTTASHKKKKCANFMAELWKPIIQYETVPAMAQKPKMKGSSADILEMK